MDSTSDISDERTSTYVPSQSSGVTLSGKHEGGDPEARQAEVPKKEFPEGGLRGWATVAGAFCVQFCGFGYTSSFGVYQDYYVRVYLPNESASAISWIGSVNAFVVVGCGLFAGQLYDRGYFKLAVYLGSYLLVIGLFMLSLAQPHQFYQIFLIQGVCAGLGAGLLYIPSLAVVSHYFARRRALAMAITAAGSALGSVVHPLMLNNTLGPLGFANAVRASAGLVAGMLLLALLLMRPRLPPPAYTPPLGPAVKRFVRDGAYVWTVIGLSFVTTGFYYPIYYLQLDASEHHLGREFSFYSLVILNFASFTGRLVSGLAAQKFGAPLTITAAAACCGGAVLGMIGVRSVASVVLVALFFGFFCGAYIALMGPTLVVHADDFSEIGARMGVGFAVQSFGSLVGQLGIGYVCTIALIGRAAWALQGRRSVACYSAIPTCGESLLYSSRCSRFQVLAVSSRRARFCLHAGNFFHGAADHISWPHLLRFLSYVVCTVWVVDALFSRSRVDDLIYLPFPRDFLVSIVAWVVSGTTAGLECLSKQAPSRSAPSNSSRGTVDFEQEIRGVGASQSPGPGIIYGPIIFSQRPLPLPPCAPPPPSRPPSLLPRRTAASARRL